MVENTEGVHHMIVCTLCSCYPKMLLGIPPAWYKSREYRSRAVIEPRTVLKEFGCEVPNDVEVRVVDSTADLRYFVLPKRPAGTEGLSEAAAGGAGQSGFDDRRIVRTRTVSRPQARGHNRLA